MTVEILQAFQDIHTGKVYGVGEKVNFTPERVAEIHQNLPGFVKELDEPDQEKVEEPEIQKKKSGRKTKVADDESAVD